MKDAVIRDDGKKNCRSSTSKMEISNVLRCIKATRFIASAGLPSFIIFLTETLRMKNIISMMRLNLYIELAYSFTFSMLHLLQIRAVKFIVFIVGRKVGIYFMTIDQKIVEYAKEVVKESGQNKVLETNEIIREVNSKYGIKKASIIPSDYCYNRVNNGIQSDKPTLFIYKGRNQYVCVGLNYQYNGVIWHRPKGKKAEIPVGKCINGERIFS